MEDDVNNTISENLSADVQNENEPATQIDADNALEVENANLDDVDGYQADSEEDDDENNENADPIAADDNDNEADDAIENQLGNRLYADEDNESTDGEEYTDSEEESTLHSSDFGTYSDDNDEQYQIEETSHSGSATTVPDAIPPETDDDDIVNTDEDL